MILIPLLACVILKINVFAQDVSLIDSKVDSVFNSYFAFLSKDISEIDTVDYELIGKELETAILIYDFFENISGIYLQRQVFGEHEYPESSHGSYCYSTNFGFTKVCAIYTEEDYKSWKKWYYDNKTHLTWINDDQKISSESVRDFYYFDYRIKYPSSIRFKDEIDIIPIADKPKQLIELEKQMDKSRLAKSKAAIIENKE